VAASRRRFLECDAGVRRHLEANEGVIAVGRCADITEIGGPEQGGAASTYIMVTDRKIRWVPGTDLKFETSLDFDDITESRERSVVHRWAILLTHPSVEHPRFWPGRGMPADLADRLRDHGRLRDDPGPLTLTEFAFSRWDTASARALRSGLRSRHLL
jgi:hypothetical protein